jgi:hypothetical protein
MCSVTALSTVVIPNTVPLGSYGFTIQGTAAVSSARLEVWTWYLVLSSPHPACLADSAVHSQHTY